MSSTVLIIDDSPTIRKIIRVHLMGLNFSYIEADGGQQALTLLKTTRVDLIIADINMPGMDGVTFVRRLRTEGHPEVKDLPVILLTANLAEDLRKQGLAAGANAFLLKPVASANLVETVRRLIGPSAAQY